MPREVVERIERIREYHVSSKLTYLSVRQSPQKVDWTTQPSPFRIFENEPIVKLLAESIRVDAPALAVLTDGVAGKSQPSQDLQTLASWLHLASGITGERRVGKQTFYLRSCPSSSALFPFEIYVAAFGIDGLEPGFYHYSVKEGALRKLRDGHATLAQLKKGRPDLQFLKTVPAALLVSTIFCRSTWRYRQRGYRYSLIDAGHLVQNLVTAANGLGIQTTTRLSMNDRNTRELIGLSPDAPYGEAEGVQAMVVWAETASQPLVVTAAPPSGTREILPPIERIALSADPTSYDGILMAHDDCVAPGIAVRAIRSPATEWSPLKSKHMPADLPVPNAPAEGPPLGPVMTKRRSARDFLREPISLDTLWTINRLAFRGGSHFPIFPTGPHVGLIRPMWIVNDVAGLDPGVWHYRASDDRWLLHRPGEFRLESQYLCLEQPICGNASAVCFMIADLQQLMNRLGPDTYRLAHLEAGVVAQRMFLAAEALGVGCAGIGPFYDDETIAFLEPDRPGWETIYSLVLGVRKPDSRTKTSPPT